MYYLRTRPKADAIQFTVDQEQLAKDRKSGDEKKVVKRPVTPVEEEECLNCGA